MAVQIQTAVTPIDSRIVENACQHLRTVSQFLLEEKECQPSDSKGVLVVVEALLDLDQERQRLHDALEAETIKASVLRHKLLNVPLETEKEIQGAVNEAREANLNEITEVQQSLQETKDTIAALKNQLNDIHEHDAVLNPKMENISFTHEDIVSDLNFLLNDKAQVQIELNETWEEVKCTKKNIGRTENGILQLHEDLINERENAKITRKELRGEILNTKRRKEEQLSANDVAVRQIERLKLALAEVKVENQEKRSDVGEIYKNKERLDGIFKVLERNERESRRKLNEEIFEGKEIGKGFAVMVKEYEEKREDQEKQLKKVHKELAEASQNAAKLEKERNQLHNTLKGAKTAAGRSAASLRLLNESLKNSKQELLDQSEEAARLKRDNAELEFRIQQANEGHKLNVELLTGQIEEVRESLAYEVDQKNVCQREREKLRKKELAWKKEYQFSMNQLTIRIHALKEQNTNFVQQITSLKKEIESGDELVIKLRKQSSLDKEESIYVCDELNNEIMDLDNLIINTQVKLVKLQDTLDEMKPVFVGLEKEYADKQLYYEEEKKVTVERKGDKQTLEDKITKLKRDIKRLQMPREKLMAQIRDSRFSSLNQIREQARENLETEQNIKLMEEKKLLMGRSNDKITEKTEKLRLDVSDIEDKITRATAIVTDLNAKLVDLKTALISNYKKDLEMDGLYARVDLGILSDITEMHQTTEQRQERVADIRAQLEEQISNMENFIFRVGSPAPTPKPPTQPNNQLPHYPVVPDIRPPWRPVNRRGQPWTS
ncbi:hypothetical protein ACHWQZ_G002115 [Mnemiopsis leidyi]